MTDHLYVSLATLSANANKLVICSKAPASFDEANTTYNVGEKLFDVGGAVGSQIKNYVQTTEFIDGSILANTEANYWAILDTVNFVLMARGDIPDAPIPVTNGNEFAMSSFNIYDDGQMTDRRFEHPNSEVARISLRVPYSLRSDYDTRATTMCRCFRLQRNDGVVYGFTDHDEDVVFGGITYEASSGITPSAIDQGSDLAVDTVDIFGALVSDRLSEDSLAAGVYDNAALELWLVNWKRPATRHLLVSGSIGQVSRGKLAYKAEFRSLSHYLNQDYGRVFSKLCDADVGDSRCTVNLSVGKFRAVGTVAEVLGDGLFLVTGMDNFDDGWFNDGVISFTSGTNTNVKNEIRHNTKLATGMLVELFEAQAFTLNVGDGYIATAGCDKLAQTCQDKFDNIINHRGFMFIPGNDVIARFASKDDTNDGSSLF